MIRLRCEAPTFCFIENYSSKVLDAKLSLVAVLWWNVVCVEFVLKVQLVQHGGVGPLKTAQRIRLKPFASKTPRQFTDLVTFQAMFQNKKT